MDEPAKLVMQAALHASRKHGAPNVRTTPVQYLPGIGWIKREDMQYLGSFKARGCSTLVSEAKLRGETHLVTGSSGNHGLALAAWSLSVGIGVTVVMSASGSKVKRQRLRRAGADVVVQSGASGERKRRAMSIAEAKGCRYVSSHDEVEVIAGNSFILREILAQVPDVDCVVAPVGGGGLAAGLCLASAAIWRASGRKIDVIGVEPSGAATLALALSKGQPTAMRTRTICDGARVQMIGDKTYPLLKSHLKELLVVDDGAVSRVREDLLAYGVDVEPTAALAPAGARSMSMGSAMRRVCIATGSNHRTAGSRREGIV